VRSRGGALRSIRRAACALTFALLVAPAAAGARTEPDPFGFPPPPPALAAISTDASPDVTTLGPGLTGLTDSARVTGRTGTNNGAIEFRLYGPADPGCTAIPVYQEAVFYPAGQSAFVSTSAPFVPTQAGTYRWVARYVNDPLNTGITGSCDDFDENTIVTKASPTITTTASADGALGSVQLTDKASASGRVSPQPGGSIFFELFAPAADGSPTCSGSPVFNATVPYPQGGGEVTSPAFTPARAGSYRWRATYTGDANNTSAESPCGMPGEGTTVSRNPGATIGTNPSNPITIGDPLVLTDRAVVNGRISPIDSGSGSGTIDFRLYGPTDPTCDQAPVFQDLNNAYSGSELTSSGYSPASAGRYRWVVNYSGDANNLPKTSACSDLNSTLVDRKQPTVTIDPSDGFTIGAAATLSAAASTSGRVSARAGAFIDFKLYGPDDPGCVGTPVAHPQLISYPDTSSPLVSSPGLAAGLAGTYHWTATYTGDVNNKSFTTACAEGAILVARRLPGITAAASSPIRLGGGRTLTGQAALTGFFGLQQTGTVDFRLYGPDDTTCSGPEVQPLAAVSYPTSAGTVTSSAVGPHAPGVYRWIAFYSGDANNEPASSPCNGAATLVSKALPGLTAVASPGIALGTGSLTDTVTLNDEFEPKGTATADFRLYGPNDAGCTAAPVFTSLGVPVVNHAATSAPFTPTAAGVYRWVATYSGDANNDASASACDDPTQKATVSKPAPAVVTTPSARMTLGAGQLSATASVIDRTSPLAGATVDFRLYGPEDPACGGTPVHHPAGVPYPVAGGAVVSAPYTPARAGTYRWVAAYSGDPNNVGATGACGAAGTTTVVDRARPSIVANASAGIRVGGGSLSDSAIVTGRVNAQPGATVDFTLYGPDDATCSRPAAFHVPNVAYDALGTPTVTAGPGHAPAQPGTYRWRVFYGGDANNEPVAGACDDPSQATVVTPGDGAGSDDDRDGYAASVDCDDHNPAIHPGAVDVPNNRIDEDCAPDGPTRYPLLRSAIALQSERLEGSRSLKLTRLSIRPAVAGSAIRLRCTGSRRSCRSFKTTTRKIAKNAAVRTFSQLLPKLKLRPGARFEVRVTKPATIGRVLVLAIFPRKAAARTYLCLAPAATKPAVCPS
jgi:hypothetical protein